MTPGMYTRDEVTRLIGSGQVLLLAGDERVLATLPRGNWIGGTSPYFMTDAGGMCDRERVFVTPLPDYVASVRITHYDEHSIRRLYTDLADESFGVIILPAFSPTHFNFALGAPTFAGFASVPLVGWVAGVLLAEMADSTPKVFSGRDGTVYENGAVVLAARLPSSHSAEVHIVNIFRPGGTDQLSFPMDGFSAREVVVNGTVTNFAGYLKQRAIDTRLPLVADYQGAFINTSIQGIEEATGVVKLYAPVFRGITYRLAAPVDDYAASFARHLSVTPTDNLTFSCNCILNYLYGDLAGKNTGTVTGPVTFGEIAYQLLNQTLAILRITPV